MRRFLLVLFFPVGLYAQDSIFSIEGNYYGKNLYFQHSLSKSKRYLIRINDSISQVLVDSSSAFELDFTQWKLTLNTPLKIIIEYPHEQKFVVLNPEVLARGSALMDTIYAGERGVFWTVKHPENYTHFIVRQMRWNKWVKEDSVNSELGKHFYFSNPTPHFGENQIKLAYFQGKKEVYSQVLKFNSPTPDDDWTLAMKVCDSLHLNRYCKYELYDKFGNVLKKGEGESVYVKDLVPDVYYLNFCGRTTEFIRKKGKCK